MEKQFAVKGQPRIDLHLTHSFFKSYNINILSHYSG